MDDLLAIRAPMVTFYVLRDSSGLYLIDTGFFWGRALLRRALRHRGWQSEPIRGILLTHGHIDHVYNAASIAAETGAWVAAPRLDSLHIEGRFPYRGAARVCGGLEATCRRIFGYPGIPVERWLDDQAETSVWGDLRAVHLPGHTDGHTGFYSASRKLLFCGDLLASYLGAAHFPPNFLNSCPHLLRSSIEKACALDLAGVLPNHGDNISPARHLERLRRLKLKLS